MKLKVTLQKDPKHKELASCVGWSSVDELYSSADDHLVLKWIANESSSFTTLQEAVFPTALHWYPKSIAGAKRQMGSDLFALTSTDGRYHLITKTGRIEKVVEAHKGAALSAKWSYDGTALATSGEDGHVKIWSRSGMLRTSLAQTSTPIYSVAWSPDSDQVLYTSGRQLIIKPLQANAKQNSWKAHDGVILTLDWNPVTGLIISAGEDCRYKVWDMFGCQLFSSHPSDYPITSVSWAPNGEYFAVGSFNTLRLCDKTGWSYALEKPMTGSLFCLSWSPDSTQVAGACGNGQIVFAQLIDQRLLWKHFEATTLDSKTMLVRNVTNDTKDKLDFRDRVIKCSMAFNHLVVATSSQCYIYNTRNFNTPMIFELKEGSVTSIIQAEKLFALVDGVGIYVYSYEGRLVCTPRHANMRADALNDLTLSLSNDSIAIRDKTDQKGVFLFEAQNGKMVGDGKPIVHKEDIIQVALDQCGIANERRLAFIDKNRDLFITTVRTVGTNRKTYKLASMIQKVMWNDENNTLAALGEGILQIHYYPNVAFTNNELLSKTIVSKDTSEFGKSPQLESYISQMVILRRQDGSLVHSTVSPYISVLHGYARAERWDNALRVCRFVKDDSLWSCLAAMACYSKHLDTCEAAFAALNQADKVQFINEIKDTSSKELQKAQLCLLSGNTSDAESILLQSGNVFRAIMLNIQLFNWNSWLKVGLVVRRRLMNLIGSEEIRLNDPDFIDYVAFRMQASKQEEETKKIRYIMDGEVRRFRNLFLQGQISEAEYQDELNVLHEQHNKVKVDPKAAAQ